MMYSSKSAKFLQAKASSQKIPIISLLQNIKPPTHLIFNDLTKLPNIQNEAGRNILKDLRSGCKSYVLLMI